MGLATHQTGTGGLAAANEHQASPGRPHRSTALALPIDGAIEHRRWANVMAADHALLRQLAESFERAATPARRAELMQLALDFHEMHVRFESGWMQIPALEPARMALEDLAEQIEATAPASHLYRARGLAWKAHLVSLMRKEESHHSRTRPAASASWPTRFLEWRMALVARVKAALPAEPAQFAA
jgi:hypothetical protein